MKKQHFCGNGEWLMPWVWVGCLEAPITHGPLKRWIRGQSTTVFDEGVAAYPFGHESVVKNVSDDGQQMDINMVSDCKEKRSERQKAICWASGTSGSENACLLPLEPGYSNR